MIDAIYFDGASTRRHPVTLVIQQRVLAMRGAGLRRNARLSQLRIAERLEHAPWLLHFPDGGHLEISDAGFEDVLQENRYRLPRVVRWQQNWPLALVSLVGVVALLLAAYLWGVPWVAERVARQLPVSVERGLGESSLAELEKQRMLGPSRLPPAMQMRLRAAFGALRQPRAEHTAYRLEFRASDERIGANAFAMPGGIIVMTDLMVVAAGSDEAVLGVLSHELGHVQRRHTMRGLMQTAGVAVIVNLAVGDVSSLLAMAPAFLLEQNYSRDFEREADQYAIDMMQANRQPLAPLADMFERMASGRPGSASYLAEARGQQPSEEDDEDEDEDDDDDEVEMPVPRRGQKPGKEQQEQRIDYTSSHPSDGERSARFRKADAEMAAAKQP